MNILLEKESVENQSESPLKPEEGQLRILFLIHDNDDAGLIESFLKNNGLKFLLNRSETLKDFTTALHRFNPSVIIADYIHAQFNGLHALRYLKKNNLKIPLIIVTESQPEEVAVQCIKEGANDYIIKTNLSPLPKSILNSIKSVNKIREEDISKTRALMYNELYELFLMTLSEMNTGLAIVDSAKKEFQFVNKTFCKMCGYESNEIFKLTSLLKLFGNTDVENFKTELSKILKPEKPIHIFNSALTKKNKKKINAEFIVRRFNMHDKDQVIIVVRDITETVSKNLMKKLMEESLQVSERHYRSLIENVKDYAIFMLDFEGRIISWNEGAERIMGFKEKEIIFRKFFDFFPVNSENVIDSASLLEKAKDDEHVELELHLLKKDGGKIWASVTITKLITKDSETGTFSIIIRDLTKNKKSEELLHEQENQLRSLAKHLQDAREEERLRIARELHDEFSQMLTVLRMDLTVLGRTISKTVTEPLKRISLLEKISSISDLLERTIRSTRRIITELRPAVLDELGLYTAIQWQAQEFENRTGIRCKIIKLQYDINLDKHTSTAIFRIFQEGLTNVAKHSSATNVVISLKVIDDKLLLEIKDNGTGIDKNKLRAPTSTGLLGIRERVMALNGSFEIQSENDQGTRLLVFVPYKQEENL